MLSTINLSTIMQSEILPQIEKYGWATIELEKLFTEEILEYSDQLLKANKFKPATLAYNNQLHETIRNDQICWLEKTHLQTDHIAVKIESFLEHCRIELENYFLMALNEFECHFALYTNNHFYLRHSDQTSQNNKRFFTFVLYLNPNWQPRDGGEIRLYMKPQQKELYVNNQNYFSQSPLFKLNEQTQEIEITLKPQFSHLLFFRSDLEHEVLTSYTDRKSLTGWFRV